MTTKSSHESDHAPQLLERMFSGIVHRNDMRPLSAQRPPEQIYRALREAKPRPEAMYRLQSQVSGARVQADSLATDVMTDLRNVAAVVTHSVAGVNEAHQAMIAHGVRALFVVDEQGTVLGIITSTDILGEKPVQLAQQRGARHDEILVRDLMTPADLLEAISFEEVMQARVGDIVATLRRSGRQHALVIESAPAGAASPTLFVRGIFSLTQIARQLGLPPQPGHTVARTFAEIEAAIGA